MTKFIPSYINFILHIMLFLTILYFILNINNHPIIIIIIILIYSTLICLNISLWKSNYILSIFLFLIIIRGLLIIFLYFSRLISNVKFKLKIKLILKITLPFLINIIISFFLLKSNWLNLYIYKYKFHENLPILQLNKITFNNILNLYEYPLNNLTALSIFYLLFALFSIIKICSSTKSSSSLRKIN